MENIYGDEIKPIDNKIYISGGDIKLSDLAKTLDDIDINRLGLNRLTQEEKENQYMRYETEFSYNVEKDKEYIIVVAQIGDGLYKIVDEGCGIFVEDNSNSRISTSNILLKNVITNTKIEKNTLVKKAIENGVNTNTINKVNNDKSK